MIVTLGIVTLINEEIDGLEVKVKAVETNDGLLATEIDLEGEVETQSGDEEDDNSG